MRIFYLAHGTIHDYRFLVKLVEQGYDCHYTHLSPGGKRYEVKRIKSYCLTYGCHEKSNLFYRLGKALPIYNQFKKLLSDTKPDILHAGWIPTVGFMAAFSKKTKKLVSNLEIEDRVSFHGSVYEAEMDKIFDLAHIAIGTLAFHRIRMKQACLLKVREYTARGVPFVLAYDDIDLEDNLPFYLRLPGNDSHWSSPIATSSILPEIFLEDFLIKVNLPEEKFLTNYLSKISFLFLQWLLGRRYSKEWEVSIYDFE